MAQDAVPPLVFQSPDCSVAPETVSQLSSQMPSSTFAPSRVRSLPLSLPSDRHRCRLQVLTEISEGSCEGLSAPDSFETARIPMHSGSLDSAQRPCDAGGESMSRLSVTAVRHRHRSPITRGSHMEHRLHEFSREQGLRSPRAPTPPGGARREQEVAMDERKRLMQRQALEKAQQLKQDAKVACWIALKRQLQPGEPISGLELVGKMNLSHLDAKTLPRGKGWKTRALLRMVEGIIALVCRLLGGAEGACVLLVGFLE